MADSLDLTVRPRRLRLNPLLRKMIQRVTLQRSEIIVPVFVREGGSIGAVLSMEKVLKTPVFFLGLSLPEHGYHAPNENYDWQQAQGGMAAFATYFQKVAAMGKKVNG